MLSLLLKHTFISCSKKDTSQEKISPSSDVKLCYQRYNYIECKILQHV